MQTKQQLINKGIEGAARMGKTYAVLIGIIFIGLGVFFVIIGSWMHSDPHSLNIKSRVIQKDCNEIVSSLQYNCSLTLLYKINNKEYEKHVKNYSSYSPIHFNDEVIVHVNKNNYADAVLSKSPDWLNILLIIVGLLFILFSSVYMFYICSYKALAVLSGLKKVVLSA
jgi:hypothetical protein